MIVMKGNVPKRTGEIERFQKISKDPSTSKQPYYQQKLPLIGITKNGSYPSNLSSNEKLVLLGAGLLVLAVASAGCFESDPKEFADRNDFYAKIGTINETATHGKIDIYLRCNRGNEGTLCYTYGNSGICAGTIQNNVDGALTKDFCYNGEPKEYLKNLSKSF